MTQVDFLMASSKYASEGGGVSPKKAVSTNQNLKYE